MTNNVRNFQENRKFAEYCDSWFFANSTRLKPSSCAKYQANIKNHIKPYFGSGPVSAVTAERIDEFTGILLYEKELSAKTVRDILVLLHSILLYTERRTGRDISDLEIIYPKKKRKQIRILNEQEEKSLLVHLANQMDLYKFGIYAALRTGLRIGELCALRWRDISIDTGTISISHTVQRIRRLVESGNPAGEKAAAESSAPLQEGRTVQSDLPQGAGSQTGKNSRKTEVVLGTPKSDSSCRTIPLMPDMAALCRRFYCGGPDAFILTGTLQCMEPRKLQRHLKTCMEECGLSDVHFHTLRHTFATRCVEVGFDVKTLSEILGHANINITLNQYVHPDMKRKRENMSRLKNVICM